jgi:hypothetical protein
MREGIFDHYCSYANNKSSGGLGVGGGGVWGGGGGDSSVIGSGIWIIWLMWSNVRYVQNMIIYNILYILFLVKAEQGSTYITYILHIVNHSTSSLLYVMCISFQNVQFYDTNKTVLYSTVPTYNITWRIIL